jgi:hypothetical protein
MKKQILSEEFRRMQKLAGILTESQLNEGEESKYFTMDGTKSEDLKKDFTLKPTYDPGMTMICPKDLDDKSDRADGMLGYIFGLNTLKDKELYPLKENHPDYGKMIVMSQSTKEDLSNLIKSLGGTQIDLKAKSSSPAPQAESIEQVVNEALKVYRKRMINEEVADEDIQIGAEYTAMLATDSKGGRTPVKVKVLGRDRSDETKVIVTPLQDVDYKNAESGQMNRFTKGSQYGSEAKYLSESEGQVNELFGFGSKIEIPSRENKSKLVKVGTGDLVMYNPEYDNSGYARDNEGVYTIEKVRKDGVILKKYSNEYQTNQGRSSRDISGDLVRPSSLAYYGKK